MKIELLKTYLSKQPCSNELNKISKFLSDTSTLLLDNLKRDPNAYKKTQ